MYIWFSSEARSGQARRQGVSVLFDAKWNAQNLKTRKNPAFPRLTFLEHSAKSGTRPFPDILPIAEQ
jgi:hypothetical protein